MKLYTFSDGVLAEFLEVAAEGPDVHVRLGDESSCVSKVLFDSGDPPEIVDGRILRARIKLQRDVLEYPVLAREHFFLEQAALLRVITQSRSTRKDDGRNGWYRFSGEPAAFPQWRGSVVVRDTHGGELGKWKDELVLLAHRDSVVVRPYGVHHSEKSGHTVILCVYDGNSTMLRAENFAKYLRRTKKPERTNGSNESKERMESSVS